MCSLSCNQIDSLSSEESEIGVTTGGDCDNFRPFERFATMSLRVRVTRVPANSIDHLYECHVANTPKIPYVSFELPNIHRLWKGLTLSLNKDLP